MKKIITIIVVIMAMATIGYAQRLDPRGLNRYELSGEQSPLTIFTLPEYDPTDPNFFDGYSAKSAEELGLVGEVFWNEFGDHAEKGVLAKGAVIRFKNGFEWQEAYLEGCLKGGKPFYNRVYFPEKGGAASTPDKVLKVDGAATINFYNFGSTATATATANPTATATNTPSAPKVDPNVSPGWVDPNTPPAPFRPKKPDYGYTCPYCGYADCDGSCRVTPADNGRRGCNNCGNSGSNYVVVEQKTTPGQKMYRAFNTLANMAGATGTLLHGIAGYQGKLGTRINTYTNVFNQLPGSNTDPGGGDGGNLPPDDPGGGGDGGDLPGDGGNLPGFRNNTFKQRVGNVNPAYRNSNTQRYANNGLR